MDHRSHEDRYSPPSDRHFLGQQEAENSGFSEKPITDPLHGGGGHDSLFESEPPTTTAPGAKNRTKVRPEDITTETGRWLIEKLFSLKRAYLLQHMNLEAAKADFARRWEQGQRQGAIGDAWLVSPPLPPPLVLPAAEPAAPLDQDDAGVMPPPAGRSIEEAQARWEARRGGRL